MEVGGWVQVSLGIFFGKASQSSSKPDYSADILEYSSIQCVFCLYALLNLVSYYDLSVLSMSVMGFQKEKSLDGGGCGELYPSLFWIFGFFFNFSKPLM